MEKPEYDKIKYLYSKYSFSLFTITLNNKNKYTNFLILTNEINTCKKQAVLEKIYKV